MERATLELPEQYREMRQVNLASPQIMRRLTAWSVVLIVLSAVLQVLLIGDVSFMIDLPMLVLGAVLTVVYIVLHEGTHGLFIRFFAKVPVEYKLQPPYVSAGNREAYFSRFAYIVIALAPVLLFGVIFLIWLLYAPIHWRLLPFGLQILNVSGAVGDFYITVYTLRHASPTAYINDTGSVMTYYDRAS